MSLENMLNEEAGGGGQKKPHYYMNSFIWNVLNGQIHCDEKCYMSGSCIWGKKWTEMESWVLVGLEVLFRMVRMF